MSSQLHLCPFKSKAICQLALKSCFWKIFGLILKLAILIKRGNMNYEQKLFAKRSFKSCQCKCLPAENVYQLNQTLISCKFSLHIIFRNVDDQKTKTRSVEYFLASRSVDQGVGIVVEQIDEKLLKKSCQCECLPAESDVDKL